MKQYRAVHTSSNFKCLPSLKKKKKTDGKVKKVKWKIID